MINRLSLNVLGSCKKIGSNRLLVSSTSNIYNKNVLNFSTSTKTTNNNNKDKLTTKSIQDKVENITAKENVASPSTKSISIDEIATPQDYNYVFERAKLSDKENYRCSLLINDPSARRASYALRTFNIETVSTDFGVKTEKMAKLRLAFWKDAINNIYNGKVYDQPLTRVLAQIIKEKQLTKTWFIKLLNRREKDLQSVQLRDMDELEAYSDDIYSSLILLTLEAMGVKGNHDIEHCASHLGKAVGIMVLIRGTPFHVSRRKLYIPVELTTKYGIKPEQLFRGEVDVPALKNAIYDMASLAKLHLEKARSFKAPPPTNQAFLIAQMVEDFLRRIQQVDFNVFKYEEDTTPDALLLIKLYKNKFFDKF
ncbi:hypothetical protein CYY_004306 [Polysphondylium violaceum]|uniref:15-cis-phytoene synthase n=1 Tax=Polysphondylium violaceum TaxID=133409 RepID=A0A8J4V5C7_9MYCE|nr:hypothetical protein CYY_004306 [Polysphondylium violaceum]